MNFEPAATGGNMEWSRQIQYRTEGCLQMLMTQENYHTWVADEKAPLEVLEAVLQEHLMKDWPLPNYLLEDLAELTAIEQPTQVQVDAARIPLLNWFRQQREEQATQKSGAVESSRLSEDVLGPL